jgi:post-segregation antitoxin (ccd killing protein)
MPEPEHRPHVIPEQERRWLKENREAITSINAFIERHGLLADRLRYRRQGRVG